MPSYKKASIQEHQKVLLELLNIFDSICRKFDIKYMLFAGSALGAVRHQGFIPWDDDLDVVMLRSEYERFLQLAPGELNQETYFLQKEYSEHWPMYFSKLRKNNTACIERYVPRDSLTHQGVYIDIFPCDNLSDSPMVQKIQYLTSKIAIAKSLKKRGYLTDNHAKKAFILLCSLFPIKPMLRFTLHREASNSERVHTFFGGGAKFEKNIYPRDWFIETVLLQFENGQYPVSAHYDKLLSQLYGDYMTPLPETQRGCKVHAELVDLENSYTNYLKWQRDNQFAEFSRSIR